MIQIQDDVSLKTYADVQETADYVAGAITKLKEEIEIAEYRVKKITYSSPTSTEQTLRYLFLCLIGIPEVVNAPNNTRFACNLFYDAFHNNDNRTIQMINTFIKNSYNQFTTIGLGQIIHPTEGRDLHRITFNSTGEINSYYASTSGKNFQILSNRSFVGNVNVDGVLLL
jgi:hypothetical protein